MTATAQIPSVTILLSTFNGARFLPEQLNSLLEQTHTNWILYWRDDGSADNTIAVMQDFTQKIGPARCIRSPSSGPHLGASPSFLTLLAETANTGPIAFADQDDVWLPTKLQRAITQITQAGPQPALYCARQLLVNEHLQNAKLSVTHQPVPSFPASLTQNIANGNTLVMNQQAASLVASLQAPEGTVHDWWSYIAVTACGGHIIFDEQPQILYRLHKNNLIGRAQPLPGRAIAALRRGPEIFMTMMQRHADALAANTGRLTQTARSDLKLIQSALHGNLINRLQAISCPRFRRRTWLENTLFTYWFLTASPQPTQTQSRTPNFDPQLRPATAGTDLSK